MDRSRRLIRNMLALSGGEAASKLLGLFAFAWLARALGPSTYGVVEVAGSLVMFFSQVVDLGLGRIGAREVARDPAAIAALAARIPAARLPLAVASLPVAMGIAWLVSSDPRVVTLTALFAVGLLPLAVTQAWLLQGRELMGWVSAGQLLRAVTFVVGVLVLVRSPGDVAWVGLVEIAAALTLAIFYLAVQRRRLAPVRLAFERGPLVRVMKEAAPLGIGQVVSTFNQYLPTLIVVALAGSVAVGIYGAAHRIVISLVSLSWLYHFNLFPSLSRSLGESRQSFDELVGTSFRVTAWAGIGLATLVSIVAEPLCILVYGPEFGATAVVLAVLAWMFPLHLLSGHVRWVLVVAGHQRVLLLAQLAGAATTALVGVLAVPRLGANGAALAMLASAAVVWGLAHFSAVRRVRPLPFPGAVLRASLAALVAALVASPLELPALAKGAIVAALYAIGALALERAVLEDARALVRALRPGPRGSNA